MNPASCAEILEAVATVLRMPLQQPPDRRMRFHLRVAANLISMLQREQATGAQAADAERMRLRALLAEAADELEDCNVELCRRIALGEMGLGNPALLAHLWRTTLDRLAIDQPEYRWR